MTEKEWFRQFKRELSALPRAEREAAVQYYRELFGDRSDGGEREEDILASFGAPAQAAAGILAEREEKAPARSAGGAGRTLVGMLLMVFVAFPVGLAVFVIAVTAGALEVGTLTCSTELGDVSLDKALVQSAQLSSELGDVTAHLSGVREDYSVTVRTEMGECNISSYVGGARDVTAQTSMGDIFIAFEN